jgi:hypothetical protein
MPASSRVGVAQSESNIDDTKEEQSSTKDRATPKGVGCGFKSRHQQPLTEMNMPKKAENPVIKPVGLEPKGTGRPSKYTPEIAKKMCEMLADGVPLREICRQEGFPAWVTVYEWMYRDDAAGEAKVGLSEAIAKAREVGQDAMAERAYLEMYQEPERIMSEGGNKIDPGYVQLVKARAEITLKMLAKWNPKRYGDRVALTGAEDGAPIKIESRQLFDAVLTNLETRRQLGEE